MDVERVDLLEFKRHVALLHFGHWVIQLLYFIQLGLRFECAVILCHNTRLLSAVRADGWQPAEIVDSFLIGHVVRLELWQVE